MNIFKEVHQFYSLYPKIATACNGGHQIFNFCFLAIQMLQILNLVKIGPIVVKKKMSMHDAQRTTDNARRTRRVWLHFFIVLAFSFEEGINTSTQDIVVEEDVTLSLRNSFNWAVPFSVGKYLVSSCLLLYLVITAKVSEYFILYTCFVDALKSLGSTSSPIMEFISVDFPEQVSPLNTFIEDIRKIYLTHRYTLHI